METNSLIAIIGSMAGGFAIVFIVFRSGLLAYLYDAKIGEVGIDIVILSSIRISTLPYSEISRVKEVGFLALSHFVPQIIPIDR